MAVYVLQNPKFYLHTFDLSGLTTSAKLQQDFEVKEKKGFGSNSKQRVCGIEDWSLDIDGLQDCADDGQDETIRTALAIADKNVTVCHTTGAAGELAYFGQAVVANYQWGGAHGDLAAFKFTASASGSVLVPSTVLYNSTAAASGNGTAYQLGAVGATQTLYGMLHCLTASAGDTLDVIVQSDDAVGMASPTTRLTFAQIASATPSSEMKSAAGPITDTYFRISWTISGTDPSFTFVVSVGIK